MQNLLLFEKKVLDSLSLCGIGAASVSEKSPLGVAVSGGADSVSLLLSLAAIFPPHFLRVITVDHGIRSKEEGGGDAAFVADLCEKHSISCFVAEIEPGGIERQAKSSGESVEALARKVRYEAFDSFIQTERLCALALAHNQNDQTETLLMRFLQGSATEGMSGIKRVRGAYIRPLLDIPRAEIELYLREKGQGFRTDSTNSDTKYFRNKVRNVLVPILNEHFSGWQKALLSGAKKAAADEEFLASLVPREEFLASFRKTQSLDRAFFYGLHDALKRRVFFSALNEIGFGGRFPFAVFEEVASWEHEKSREISFENVKIALDSEKISFSVREAHFCGGKTEIEGGFSFLFRKAGDRAEIGNLFLRAEPSEKENQANLVIEEKSADSNNSAQSKKISLSVALPFLVRSFIHGDEIKAADGTQKNLSDIFTDWKIPPRLREKALVVEEFAFGERKSSLVRAVIAFFIGAKNWIVEEAKL